MILLVTILTILFYKQSLSFSEQMATLFEENGVNQKDCLTWALGEGYGIRKLTETDEIWNERHGDLFIMKGTDLVLDSTLKIINEYKKYKGIK